MLKDDPDTMFYGTKEPPKSMSFPNFSKSKHTEKTKKNNEETHEQRIIKIMKDKFAIEILKTMEETKHRRTTERKKNIFQIIFGSDDEYIYNELIKKSSNQLKKIAIYSRIWMIYYNDASKIIKDIKEAQILIGLVNAQVAMELEMEDIFQDDELYNCYSMIKLSFVHCMNNLMDSHKKRHNKELQCLLHLQRMNESDFYLKISSKARNEVNIFDNFDTIPISKEKRNELVQMNHNIQPHFFFLCYDYPLSLIEAKFDSVESGPKLIQSNANSFKINFSPSKTTLTGNISKHSKLIKQIQLNHIKNGFILPYHNTIFFKSKITSHILNLKNNRLFTDPEKINQIYNERGCFIKIPSIYQNEEIFILRSDEYNVINTKTNFFTRINGREILEGFKKFHDWNLNHRSNFIQFYFYLGYMHDCVEQDCIEDPTKFLEFFFKKNEEKTIRGIYLNATLCGFFRHLCEKLGLSADLATPKSEFIHEIYSKNFFE